MSKSDEAAHLESQADRQMKIVLAEWIKQQSVA